MDNGATLSNGQFGGIKRAAKITGLSEMCLRKWARTGKIPARRAGRLILFDLAELDRWLAGLPGASESIPTPKRKARA